MLTGISRLYRDQLDLSESHLSNLLDGTTQALGLLAKLSESFKSVESQTTAFQAQCEDLLVEQKRIRGLADEVGADLQYYAYLEPLTRRMNTATGSRLVKSDDFLDVLVNLNTCVDFMDEHVCVLLFIPKVAFHVFSSTWNSDTPILCAILHVLERVLAEGC